MKTIMVSGSDLFGFVILNENDIVVGVVDEGSALEWMLGKAWREVYCWNRIKKFSKCE